MNVHAPSYLVNFPGDATHLYVVERKRLVNECQCLSFNMVLPFLKKSFSQLVTAVLQKAVIR